MNSDFSKLSKEERDARITALILGELSPAEAEEMRHAIAAGHLAQRAGRIPRKLYATASSPLEGVIGT